MKTRGMVRIFMISGVVIGSLVLFSSNAFAWGSITHALIDDNLGKKTKMNAAARTKGCRDDL